MRLTLMAEVDEQEILQTLAGTQPVTAPGQDGVSTGVWKIALQAVGKEAVRRHPLKSSAHIRGVAQSASG